MGADQSLQTPEEHQRSIEDAKTRQDQNEKNKIMAAAAKVKQEEINYQNRLKRKEDDANKNYKSYASDVVKLILKFTVKNHKHKTLYFHTFWYNDRVSYDDVYSYCALELGEYGDTRISNNRSLKKMRYPCVSQEVKKILAEYGYDCVMLDPCHSPSGHSSTKHIVYFSVTKTQDIRSTYNNSQNIFVAPSS